MTPHFSASRAATLGMELKMARTRKRMKQKEVAARLGRAPSHVSRWERGQLLASVEDTASMLTLYEVHGEEKDRLLSLARQAADPNWIVPGVGRGLAAIMEIEKGARRIVNNEPLIIPGLCQTEPYAHAIMAGEDVPQDQADERVRIRLARQELLTGPDAPEYCAIIGEYALRHWPCNRAAMADQLRKLLDLAQLDHVSILILPFDAGHSAALGGSFVLMDLLHGDSQVHREGYRATMTLTNRRDVHDYELAVKKILRKAMSAEDSKALIAELLSEMEGGIT